VYLHLFGMSPAAADHRTGLLQSPPTIDNSEPNKARTALWGWELERYGT
jgi:hypothetical protein